MGRVPPARPARTSRASRFYADAQERKVRELQQTVLQLQSALDSRVVIERAI
jgi:hypothetical protein